MIVTISYPGLSVSHHGPDHIDTINTALSWGDYDSIRLDHGTVAHEDITCACCGIVLCRAGETHHGEEPICHRCYSGS